MLKNFLSASIAVACVLAASQAMAGGGDLDPKFDGDGMATTAFDLGGNLRDTVQAQVIGKGGSTFLIGSASMDEDDSTMDTLAIAKFQHDGKLDSTFGFGGRQLLTVPGVDFWNTSVSGALAPDGKLVVATTIVDVDGEFSVRHGLVCRFNSNGFLDSSFGNINNLKGCARVVSKSNNGNSEARVTAVTVRPDGGILLGGNFLGLSGVGLTGFASLKKDGKALDTSFGSNGYALFPPQIDSMTHIALAPDGGLTGLARQLEETPLGDRMHLLKLNAITGIPSADFGDAGVAPLGSNIPETVDQWASNFDFMADGSIYVVGNMEENGVSDPFVARLKPQGLPDVSFGESGMLMIENSPLLERQLFDVHAFDGGIVLAGGWLGAPELVEWGVMALDHNGNAISNFGEMGESKIFPFSYANSVEAQGNRLLVTGWGDGDFEVARLDHGSNIIFSVSPVAAPNGSISPSGTKFVLDSNVAEFKIVPDPGFKTIGVIGCEGGELIGTRYRTGPITQSCVVKPLFAKIATLP